MRLLPSPSSCILDFGDVDLAISIIAAKTRLASAPPAASASINTRGVICQDMPQRSLQTATSTDLFWRKRRDKSVLIHHGFDFLDIRRAAGINDGGDFAEKFRPDQCRRDDGQRLRFGRGKVIEATRTAISTFSRPSSASRMIRARRARP